MCDKQSTMRDVSSEAIMPIDINCYDSEDVRVAKRKVHEAMMTANKAIALGGER